MLLLRVCLFWFLISLHVVGGAALFRRLFPRESPWFGFIVPALALVLLLNFVEHCVAFTSLLWLLPFTAIGSICAILDPETRWKGLRLPTGIFLVAFACTLTLRALKPSILNVSSGNYDMTLISSFCMGHRLPAAYSWFPPYTLGQYYTFVHYSASVLTRLLDVDVGTGFNLSSALLSAWMCFAYAAIAWVVSRQSCWITIAAAVLTECAANGSSAYMWLTTPNLDPIVTSDLFIAQADPDYPNRLVHLLHPVGLYERRELEIPGFWSWLGSYHATNGGQFFTLFSVWSLVELMRRWRSNWPWIALIVVPGLTLVTSTWAVPIVGVLMIAGLLACAYYRFFPQNPRLVLAGVAVTASLLAPTLLDFLPTQIYYFHDPITKDTHTQLIEFGIYWWPIFLPWLAVLFIWPKLPPAVKIVHALTPLFFWWVESTTFGVRIDMTGKVWGFIWGAAWSVLFPVVAMRRGWGFRILTALLLISNLVSLCSWIDWTKRTIDWDNDVLELEGTGGFRTNQPLARILKSLSLMQGQIVLTGIPCWNSSDNGMLANFTKNYSYINGCFYIDNTFCPDDHGAAALRDAEAKDFYAGKFKDPLSYLRYRNITAVVIWPDNNLTDAQIADFKQKLAPFYEYEDFREGTAPNAGLFIFHQSMENLRPGIHPPAPVPSPPPPETVPGATPAKT